MKHKALFKVKTTKEFDLW